MSKHEDLLAAVESAVFLDADGVPYVLFDSSRRWPVRSVKRGAQLIDGALVRVLSEAPRGLVKR
jgi:hypothetical protein